MTCPHCHEPRGARYEHKGQQLCWSCWMRETGLGPLPAYTPQADPAWVVFRKAIVDGLWALEKSRFAYIDRNTVQGACPLCIDGTLRVDFKGTTPRADLTCSFGCDEQDIGRALIGRRAVR